jgi:ubiquinone/menaquinone biosynthesis C-methylase UbiE
MQRRNEPEAMDAPELDPTLLAEDLRNLVVLNRLFGGRSVVRRRVAELLAEAPSAAPLAVLDVGSGAGDLCREVLELGRAARRPMTLWSLDFHPQIQSFARAELAAYPEARFIRGDAREMPLRSGSVDVALCTLALHHFSDEDAVRVLAEMRRVSRRWAVVSDLRRGRAALAGVWLATRFTRNRMTRQDGPQSVQRAFTGEELREMAREAGWRAASLLPEPWFRMSLVHREAAP